MPHPFFLIVAILLMWGFLRWLEHTPFIQDVLAGLAEGLFGLDSYDTEYRHDQ